MADRRMFTKKVTDDDNFMGLSSSAQALYLHLSMSADDDGFSNQVSVSMFKAHASLQDLQALLEKRYIYQFENGVIVIKHWRMANALRKDRYTPTAFQEELKQLQIKDNGSYTWLPDGCQMVASWLPQVRSGQDRSDQDRSDKVSQGQVSQEEEAPTADVPYERPTIDQIRAYCKEIGTKVDPERFFSYYSERNGWQGIRSWKALLRSWAKDDDKRPAPSSAPQPQRKGSYFVPTTPNKWQEAYDASKGVGEDDGLTDEEIEDFNRMLRGGSE